MYHTIVTDAPGGSFCGQGWGVQCRVQLTGTLVGLLWDTLQVLYDL